MSQVGYSISTGGAVALAAAAAKVILGAKAHANSGLQLKGWKVAFDGTTPTNVPVLVEICYCTFATNPPGTNSTNVTPAQKYGRLLTAGFTGGANWTSLPTVITPFEEWLLTPNAGVIGYQYPLGQEPDTALGEGLLIRVNAPNTVSVRSSMDLERI